MTSPAKWPTNLASDLVTAITFCTRLPLGFLASPGDHDLKRATWALPLAGIMIGLFGAFAYWVAFRLGLAPLSAAVTALLATSMVTGCLHEDGLADTADGFGGGASPERKLAIMRDSRIGTFGVCALIASFALRWSALVTLAEPAQVAAALIAAHVAARATLPALMRFVPPARADGLSAQAGRPPLICVIIAAILAIAALGLALAPMAAIVSMIGLAIAGVFMAWLSARQIGGQTGDVLGAVEQIGEVLVLLVAATSWHAHA
jgi:adenosylcobinamide-GDP ribazoletransferase